MQLTTRAAWLVIPCLTACAHDVAGSRLRPSIVDAHGLQYVDDAGLAVTTVGAALQQRLSRHVSTLAHLLVDRIVVSRDDVVHEDDSGQATGHVDEHIDAVSSASVTHVHGGALDKLRFEGTLGTRLDTDAETGPLQLQLQGRLSVENDYRSLSGKLSGRSELFEGNTTVSAFAGYGHDVSDPVVPPPGEAAEWPAAIDRASFGGTVHQVLGRRITVSGGAAAALHYGTLQSPYRRALVRTTLFPESLSSRRVRVTAFLGLAAYLGWGTALHVKPGGYVDSWGVLAFVPELRIARDLGARGVLWVRYRYYAQDAASFYEARYEAIAEPRSGDPRLGRVVEHSPGLSIDYALAGEPGMAGALTLGGSYELAWLAHRSVQITTVSHVLGLRVAANY